MQHGWTVLGLVGLLALPLLHLLLKELPLAILPAEPANPSVHFFLNPIQLGTTLTSLHTQPKFDWSLGLGLGFVEWLWLIVGLGIVGRYVYGFYLVKKIVATGNLLPSESSQVTLVQTPEVSVPVTAWIGHSVILVPMDWDSWSVATQEAVFLHELAHIERRDWLTQFLGRLACAVLWFNPLVWVIANRSRMLAELAADDSVLAHGWAPNQYAEVLFEVVKNRQVRIPYATLGMAQRSNLVRRIEMILDSQVQRNRTSGKAGALGSCLLLMVLVPSASLAFAHQANSSRGPTQPATKEPAILKISCWMVKPGKKLSDLGFKFQKTFSQKGLVFTVPNGPAAGYVESWTKEKALASSPVIMTMDGQEASMTIQAANKNEESMKFIPHVEAERNLSIQFTYTNKVGGSTSFSESFSYKTGDGHTTMFARRSGPNKPPEVLGMVQVTVMRKVHRP